jgi:hypothetical protein
MPAAAHLRRLREALDGPITFRDLVARLGREGIGLLAFLLALPFLQPIPLAGLGTPVGILLMALGLQLALGHDTPALPRFVADRRLEKETVDRLLSGAERVLNAVSRIAKPRWAFAARSPRAYGAALTALIALALLEDDGLLGILGLAGTLGTVAYHWAYLRLVWIAGKAFLAKHV